MLDLFPGSPKKQTITEVMPNRSWMFQTRDLGQLLFAALGPNSAPPYSTIEALCPCLSAKLHTSGNPKKKKMKLFSFDFSSSSPMLKQSFRPLLKEACL